MKNDEDSAGLGLRIVEKSYFQNLSESFRIFTLCGSAVSTLGERRVCSHMRTPSLQAAERMLQKIAVKMTDIDKSNCYRHCSNKPVNDQSKLLVESIALWT